VLRKYDSLFLQAVDHPRPDMIAVLGINHKTANIDIREGFYISCEKVGPLAEEILQKTSIREILIFSTCNRTEIYFYTENTCHRKESDIIIDTLHTFLDRKKDYSKSFYSHSQRAAIKHLFRVTSGIDSMLLGEVQIVNQVKEAYLHCTKLTLTDAVLMRLFQKAFEASKRVRSETNIQKGATSISYVAIDMCAGRLGDISEKKILLIGGGETGQKALNHLWKKGARNIIISNRTFDVAEQLAKKTGGTAVPFEERSRYYAASDIIIAATNAGRNIISQEDVSAYAGITRTQPQMLIDLSVPRNIDESVANIQNISLIGVDDLQTVTEKTARLRNDSLSKAEEIIEVMAGEYLEWYNHRKLRSIIKTITTNLQLVHEQELSNSEKCYTAREYALIKEYSSRLSQKYSRLLIRRLKKLSNGQKDVTALKKISDLFDIHND
jgi:glutamyl-tRNA reductase